MANGIKIGASSFDALKIGNADVDALYLGDTLIYSGSTPTHDYSLDYFTIESESDNNEVTFNNTNYSTTTTKTDARYFTSVKLYYSTDDGATWNDFNSVRNQTRSIATLNIGDKVLFKSTSEKLSNLSAYHWFNCSNNFKVYGNIMSLKYGDNFSGQTSLPSVSSNYTGNTAYFGSILKGQTNLTDVSNLILPATTLAVNCYRSMFQGCSSITTSPILPATTLKKSCYYCLFYNCTSLNNITCLATDISENGCTQAWVTNVAANGTFYKNPSMSSWETSDKGIPSGWTVVNYSG